jgi:putative membrane protein
MNGEDTKMNNKFLARRMTALCLPVLSAMLAWSCAGGGNSNDFAKDAAQGGMAEVLLGRLAAERGASPAVREFGQQMVTDHSKANAELMQIAGRKNIQLPTEVKSDQKSEQDKLSKLTGADFDKEYVDYMTKDHEEDASEFQKQSQSGGDAEIKAFAAKTLPVIQHHLQMIKEIKSKM